VARYQSQTATFTTTQPAGAFSQFGNLWTHDYKVTINPCDNTFSGTGVEYGQDQNGAKTRNENVTGTFSADGTTSLVTTRNDGVDWSLTNAKTDGSGILVQLLAPAGPSLLEFKVTPQVVSTYKNHRDYVCSRAAAPTPRIPASGCRSTAASSTSSGPLAQPSAAPAPPIARRRLGGF